MPPRPDRPLFLLDYDGTLAPIVDDPAAARPHAEAPALLARLAERHPVVILTGRDLATLGRLLVTDDGAAVAVRAVGLHGAEHGTLGGAVAHDDRHAEAFDAMRASRPRGAGRRRRRQGRGVRGPLPARAGPRRRARAPWTRGPPARPRALEPVAGQFVVELRPPRR